MANNVSGFSAVQWRRYRNKFIKCCPNVNSKLASAGTALGRCWEGISPGCSLKLERAVYMPMNILEGNGREGSGEEAAVRVTRYPVLQPAPAAPLKARL